MKEKIEHKYGNRLRVRVSGIYFSEDKLLMLKHDGLGPKGFMWLPPGGGVDFGSSLPDNLDREFREETGLGIRINRFLFIHEFIQPPFHALEIFFQVDKRSGEVQMGQDPELGQDQMISQLKFMDFGEINRIPPEHKHQIFKQCSSKDSLLKLSGYFKIENYSIK